MRLGPGTILRDKYRIVRAIGERAEWRRIRGAARRSRGALRSQARLRGRHPKCGAARRPPARGARDVRAEPSGDRARLRSGSGAGWVAVHRHGLPERTGPSVASCAPVVRWRSRTSSRSSRLSCCYAGRGAPPGHHSRRSGARERLVLDAEADTHARAKILDFGVAKIRAQAGGIVRDAGAPGASGYAAPERQARRDLEVDERTDVFALGAIAFALISGSAPPAHAATGARGVRWRDRWSRHPPSPRPSRAR